MKRITILGLSISSATLALVACVSSGGETFDSAEHAVDALIEALREGDLSEAGDILGAGSEEVLHSGDEVADKNGIQTFLEGYDEAHRLEADGHGGMTLIVGKGDWPMPIPLAEKGGEWSFDTEAGLDELLSRRIGRNELDAVEVCLAIVDAQREYAASDPDGDGMEEYAQKFMSDEGKKNGLFWPTKEGEPESPLGPLVADAEEHGYTAARGSSEGPRPYRGYYYRILTAQGPSARGGELDYLVNGKLIFGFAVVAYPADYGNSGIMTFMVNHDGVVFQKDLGEETVTKVRAYTTFGPGAGWTKVE